MEAEIGGRVASTLQAHGWQTSDFVVRGRDVTVTGPAYEFAAATGEPPSPWIAETDGVNGVRLVRDRLQTLIELRPYVLSATKEGRDLTVSGNVPRPQVRDDIVAGLSKPGVTLQDRTNFAKGAPAGLGPAANLVFGQLAALTAGKATVIDDSVSLAGTAPDKKTRDAILSALNGLPAGFKLGDAQIDVPSLDFTATKDSVAKTLTLSGIFPDEATRRSMLDGAKERLAGARVIDRSTVQGLKAPSGFSTAALEAFRSLGSLTDGKLTVRDAVIALSGTAPDAATSETIRKSLSNLPAGFELGPLKIDVPSFDFTAIKDSASKRLTLSGVFPDEATRRSILDAVQHLFEGVSVEDQTTSQASIAPSGFSISALEAVRSLARLTDGKLTVKGSNISMSGTAPDRNTGGAIALALGNLPAGFRLSELKIEGPPYEFTAAKDPTGGTLTLDGLLPDESTRRSVLDAARTLFFRERVIDRTSLDAKGAPSGFSTTAPEALRALSRLEAGKLTVGGAGVTMTGTTHYPRAADGIRTDLAAVGGSFVVLDEVSSGQSAAPVEAAECQSLLDDLLGRGRVLFETGSARIDRVSAGLLDSLAGTVLRCPSSKFEIGGHTDSSGQNRANIDLSQRRAEAVVDYLANAGIEKTRLKAVGYGARKPVASNDTDDGKAKNRRIEIRVK